MIGLVIYPDEVLEEYYGPIWGTGLDEQGNYWLCKADKDNTYLACSITEVQRMKLFGGKGKPIVYRDPCESYPVAGDMWNGIVKNNTVYKGNFSNGRLVLEEEA